MSRLRSMTVLAATAVLAGALILSNPMGAEAKSGPREVQVVNEVASPVPVAVLDSSAGTPFLLEKRVSQDSCWDLTDDLPQQRARITQVIWDLGGGDPEPRVILHHTWYDSEGPVLMKRTNLFPTRTKVGSHTTALLEAEFLHNFKSARRGGAVTTVSICATTTNPAFDVVVTGELLPVSPDGT